MIYFTFAGRLNNKNQVGLRTKIKKLLYLLFKPIIANPDFEDKFDYVSRWYIEYNDREGYVNREIGIDDKDGIVNFKKGRKDKSVVSVIPEAEA